MYQDVFLEMMENTDKEVSRKWTSAKGSKITTFNVNQPFMFVLTLGHDILGK